MKSLVKNQLLSALFLTGVLSLSTSVALVQKATAVTQKNSSLNMTPKGELISDHGRGSDDRSTSSQLPARVAKAVIVDLSKQTGISVGQLQVTQYSRQTWSNGCLGLAKPGEICTQAVVEGWRVVVSNGQRNWVYRSDRNGRVLRLEARNTANNLNNLPGNVANLVLRDAAKRLKVSSSQVKIVKAERRNWSDGCLGLGRPEYQCAAVVTPGWLVTVEGRQQRLVYRTGDVGGAIAFDAAVGCSQSRYR